MEISLPVAIAISGRRNLGLEVEPSLELAYLKLSSSGFHLAVDSGTRTQLTKKKQSHMKFITNHTIVLKCKIRT